jgi:phosphatidylglycerophosphate synthase
MSRISSTYKSGETEEVLDVVFYRPLGYSVALASRALRLTPNAVTFSGAVVGIIGGHLLYYPDMATNLFGILLILVSEAMDSADGQLARMTGTYSNAGRVLDGIGDNLKFVSIYVHLTLRMIGGTGAWWLFGIAALSGLSHSTQSAIADYFRTSFLHYVVDPAKGDLETVESIERRYNALSWTGSFFDKIVGRLYLNYARQQSVFIAASSELFKRTTARFGTDIPAWFRTLYRQYNQHLTKYYNILTTNTRMIVLFAAVLTREFWMYFAFELTVLNALLLFVVWKQRSIAHVLLQTVNHEDKDVHR